MNKKTKKELKKAIKRSRKRLQQIGGPTVGRDGIIPNAELDKLRAFNGLLKAENSILKTEIERINNECTNRLEDGYPKGYYCTYMLKPGEVKIFYGTRVKADDSRVQHLEAENTTLKEKLEEKLEAQG